MPQPQLCIITAPCPAHAIADTRALAGVSQASKSLSLALPRPKANVDALSLEHENKPILLSRLPRTFPRMSTETWLFSLYNPISFDLSRETSLHPEISFLIFGSHRLIGAATGRKLSPTLRAYA